MNKSNIIVNQTSVEFQNWFNACDDILRKHMAENYPRNQVEHLVAEQGSRYIRVMRETVEKNDQGKPFSCSAWAFIDRTNGDVLKPASWKAPAKHARGNIFDADKGMKFISWLGPAYLRG